ncbi:MAG: hypothetical protein JWL95_3249 [Gemmatimonadetes bacterium]|nr:hypothetical protein [Gemmatimonadota bacterium]
MLVNVGMGDMTLLPPKAPIALGRTNAPAPIALGRTYAPPPVSNVRSVADLRPRMLVAVASPPPPVVSIAPSSVPHARPAPASFTLAPAVDATPGATTPGGLSFSTPVAPAVQTSATAAGQSSFVAPMMVDPTSPPPLVQSVQAPAPAAEGISTTAKIAIGFGAFAAAVGVYLVVR